MSLTAFKRKSVIQYGSKRSGKPPGGFWLPQGPFGPDSINLKNAINNYGPVGFSLNGPHRSVGYVGKDSKFSKNGTPFRGKYPLGSGGVLGTYPQTEPIFNVNEVIVLGEQPLFVKQSVLSTYGMLAKKYRWIKTGTYPNYWVQPLYTGNQTETSSQGMYLHDKTASSICSLKVNNKETYEGHIVNCSPTLCTPGSSTSRFKYNDMARNAPYTKILGQPVDASQYTLYVQKKCTNPTGDQKPFPYAVQTGTGILTGGTRVTSVGNACNTSNVSLTPPEWYINSNPPYLG